MSLISNSQQQQDPMENLFNVGGDDQQQVKFDDPFADYQNQFASQGSMQNQSSSQQQYQQQNNNLGGGGGGSEDPFKNFQPINLQQQAPLIRRNSITSQDTEVTNLTQKTQTTTGDLKPRTFNNITNNNNILQAKQTSILKDTENIRNTADFFPQNTFLNAPATGSNNQENISKSNMENNKKDLPPNYISKNYLDSKFKPQGGYLSTLQALNNNNVSSTLGGVYHQSFSPYKPSYLQQNTTTPNPLLSSIQKNNTLTNPSSFQPLPKRDYSQYVSSNFKKTYNNVDQNQFQQLDKQKLNNSFIQAMQTGGAGAGTAAGNSTLTGLLGLGAGATPATGGLGNTMGNFQTLNAGIDALLNCQTEEIFTDDVIFLLSDEDNNLASYREIIENEKAKLTKDVDMVIHDIVNQFENIKFQLVQAINEHYKLYVENYQEFKKNIQDFRNVRFEVQNHLSSANISNANLDYSLVSNANLIKELQDLKQKNQYSKLIVQLVSQKQKEHYNKISHLSKNILARLSSVQNYYNSEYFSKQLGIIKQSLVHQAENSIKNIEQIVRPPIIDIIAQRMQQSESNQHQQKQQQSTLPTGHFQTQQHPQEDLLPERQQQTMKIQENQQDELLLQNAQNNAFNNNFSLTNQSYLQLQNQPQLQQNSFQIYKQIPPQPFIFEDNNNIVLTQTAHNLSGNIDQPIQIIQQPNVSSTFSFIKPQIQQPVIQQVLNQQSIQKKTKFATPFILQQNQEAQGGVMVLQPVLQQVLQAELLNNNRNCEMYNVSNINLQLSEIIQTSHKDIVLCVSVINNMIATGSKDSSIELWNPQTKQKCGTLFGHKGSICSLGVYRNNGTNYLMSGSDHGDCSIIIWDINSLQIVKKLEGHKAAVVNLVALQDEQTVVSSSYDRDIIFWNVNLGKEIQRLSDHKSSITTMTLQKDGRRLISAGLDNEINIWHISYKPNQVFENCSLERAIQNNSFICTLNTCFFNNENLLIGGDKDGKIQIWNLNNGNLQKQVNVNIGPIVEMLIFQSIDKQNLWFISCSTGDDNIIVTHYNFNTNTLFKSKENLFVEYGCGVNYKMQFANINNQMKVVAINQSESQKKFTIWNLTTSTL